jgi:hypothetical protein
VRLLARLNPFKHDYVAPHEHGWVYIKTGVDFIHDEDEALALARAGRAEEALTGPIVDVWRCVCGAEQKTGRNGEVIP